MMLEDKARVVENKGRGFILTSMARLEGKMTSENISKNSSRMPPSPAADGSAARRNKTMWAEKR